MDEVFVVSCLLNYVIVRLSVAWPSHRSWGLSEKINTLRTSISKSESIINPYSKPQSKPCHQGTDEAETSTRKWNKNLQRRRGERKTNLWSIVKSKNRLENELSLEVYFDNFWSSSI